MPKMNDFELYSKIRKINDQVKVCFITAYEVQKEDIKAISLSDEKSIDIIRKPIAIHVMQLKDDIKDSVYRHGGYLDQFESINLNE